MDQAVQAELDPVLALIAPHVDAAFYRARNPDVAAAGMAPAEHYWRIGWREGRDPNPWFRTDYYLRANPDVRTAGLNPFWHFLVRGRTEGRPAREPGGAWRATLDAMLPPDAQPCHRTVPEDAPALDRAALGRRLAEACEAARALVVAFSHDCYTAARGGTQLLIADEQRKFNGDRTAYLHLAPVRSRLGLAPPDAPRPFAATLDGTLAGVIAADALALVFRGLPADLRRLLVVHSLHGAQPETIATLAAALAPEHAVFWAHDYGAACPSPRLLRNDIAFCAAPPTASLACRVCVHGDARPAHVARVRALFEAVPFLLAAPSPEAASLFQRAAALPLRAVRIHPHARLEERPDIAPAATGRMRVAFVGHAVYHKGFDLFRDLVQSLRGNPAYRLFHFGSTDALEPMDGVISIVAESTAANPNGMQRAIAESRIDLVLALSPWPETFGYVAYEALAAGADLLALAGSGHVEALVRATGRGLVFANPEAVEGFFAGSRAAAFVRERRAAGRTRARLRHCGSTATLALDDAAPAPETDDPDLALYASGARITPARANEVWRFRLPPSTDPGRVVRLRSRHVVPAWEPDLAGDERRLGVAVAALTLDGEPVAAGDARRVAGWHAPESGWQWTDGDAHLIVGRARRLDVRVLPLLRYWRSPPLDCPRSPPLDAG
jgi:glycosyltransferase involved in cell wall biosynthesis